jgi:hypothetical protein
MIRAKAETIAERRAMDGPWNLFTRAEDAEKREIVKVLDRAAREDGFLAQLSHRGSQALKEYRLSVDAKAALLSGDVQWIEGFVGKLDKRMSTWLNCRLQQESW